MSNVCVSVIMPSLNVRDYIEASIRSVMNQTLRDIEIICIDAGSTDGTLEIIEYLSNEDKRIKLIKSQIKSYGYQLNCAIKASNGEYIAVVETDDYIDERMYEELYTIAANKSIDIVKGNYTAYYTQKNGEKVFLRRDNLVDKSLYNKIIIPKHEPSTATSDWYLWTGIYKRSLIEANAIKLSETPGAAFQDIGFLHRTNVASSSSYYVDKSFYYYCLDRENSSSNSGRGIEYSYNEYSKLLAEDWNSDELISLYGRMAGFFSGCINGIESKDLDNEETRTYFNWFVDKMKYSIEAGIIGSHNVYEYIWNHIYPIPNSMEEVFSAKEEKSLSLKKQIGENTTVLVLIFGCGNFGYYAQKWLNENDYNIYGYSDNNADLWGTTINGLPVIKPSEIDMSKTNMRILIANEKHFVDIKRQLLSMGISEDAISIF